MTLPTGPSPPVAGGAVAFFAARDQGLASQVRQALQGPGLDRQTEILTLGGAVEPRVYTRLVNCLNSLLSQEARTSGYLFELDLRHFRSTAMIRGLGGIDLADARNRLFPIVWIPPSGALVASTFAAALGDLFKWVDHDRIRQVDLTARDAIRMGALELVRQPTRSEVVLVHGLMTRGVWQKEAAGELAVAGMVPRCHDYGWKEPLRVMMPVVRDAAVERFKKWYLQGFHEASLVPHLVAHSFGTYIAGRAMLKYEWIRFGQIILCGAILDPTYPWSQLFARGQVGMVLNEMASGDWVVRIARLLIPDAGPSGHKGFIESDERLHQRSYALRGHSDYFDAPHCREVWIPFLRGETRHLKSSAHGDSREDG